MYLLCYDVIQHCYQSCWNFELICEMFWLTYMCRYNTRCYKLITELTSALLYRNAYVELQFLLRWWHLPRHLVKPIKQGRTRGFCRWYNCKNKTPSKRRRFSKRRQDCKFSRCLCMKQSTRYLTGKGLHWVDISILVALLILLFATVFPHLPPEFLKFSIIVWTILCVSLIWNQMEN
jgi:hypothetical protein